MYRHCLRPVSTQLLKGSIRSSRRDISNCVRQLNSENNLPWFMREQAGSNNNSQLTSPKLPYAETQDLPVNLPDHILTLHHHLSQSPLLAPSTLRVCKPSFFKTRTITDDLTLPYSRAQGRRRRGVHDAGETLGEPDDMWLWYVLAEVKEGTEGRGAIESVIRNAQRELLKSHPDLPIPKKLSRKRTGDGWEVLDMGDSLLHVVSREAAQKWFGIDRQDPHTCWDIKAMWAYKFSSHGSSSATISQSKTQVLNMADIMTPDASAHPLGKMSRQVSRTLQAVETPEGSGATVLRTIGGSELETLDPFLLLDHFVADHEGAAFPDHPHRGQATVTYMLQGSFQHEDSTGNLGTLRAGDVQWMVAGRGVKHAEMPICQPDRDTPIGLQLWINLPTEHKMAKPTYNDTRAENVPLVSPQNNSEIEVRIISGSSCGTSVPVPSIGGCWYLHMRFGKKQSIFAQELPPGFTAFIYIIKGSLRVAQSEAIPQHTTLILSCNIEEDHVSLCSEDDGTEIILVAAAPLNQPVARFGPFVMNTKDELKKALLDYRMEINGFENARRWKSSIGKR